MIGFALYRFSQGAIEQKGVRFSGAAAIAIIAYLGMSRFYVSLSGQFQVADRSARDHLRESAREYDICDEQEREFVCKAQADKLRDECIELLSH
ncbi:MAG TPA: hypothetical protein VGM88_35385 [Kofleriaceae bacterium]